MSDDTARATISTNDDPGMPREMAYWGILVGLLLAISGVATLLLLPAQMPKPLAGLTICVGFGIVLAAFGSRAGGTWGGFAAVGAAALAVMLFLLLMTYMPSDVPAFAKKGHIHGDLSKIAELRIIDDDPLYTRRDLTTKSLRFIVLDRSFKTKKVRIHIDTTEKGEGREYFQMVALSDELTKRYLSNDRDVIQWTFDYGNRVIKDGDEIIFAEPQQLEERFIRGPATSLNWPGIVGSARAAVGLMVPGIAAEPTPDSLMRDLASEEAAVRRNARDLLAAKGIAALPALLDALRTKLQDYRIKLGVTFSLAQMLRSNPELSKEVARQLTSVDISRLVSMATLDRDATVRLQATEFLSLLGDTRVVTPALRQTSDGKNGFNAVLLIKAVYPKLPASEQKTLIEELNQSEAMADPKSRDIIKSIAAGK